MTTALDTIRYHSGIAGEEVADMVDSLEQEASSLREQVEKLTKERDELHRAFNQPVPRSEWEKMQEQLAALAEQNKQLKAELKSIDGALDDPRANLTLTTSEIIWELKEQVERLTEAYDQSGRTVQDYGRIVNQTESRLREVATHCANVEQQLAALAEQNELRARALAYCVSQIVEFEDVPGVAEALRLPNLSSPILNKIKAEAYREAADIVENIDVYTFVHGGSSYDDGGITLSSAAAAILDKADELENSNA